MTRHHSSRIRSSSRQHHRHKVRIQLSSANTSTPIPRASSSVILSSNAIPPSNSHYITPKRPVIWDPSTGHPRTYGRASRILQQRCPACGNKVWVRSFQFGGGCHVVLDGNFHYRHRKSAGDGSPFYDPLYFLPKSQVDEAGQRIDAAHSKKVGSAIGECEHSHDAEDGQKQKTNSEQFDDSGVMVFICRHDTPLILTSIDTPGEQQKLYDVGIWDTAHGVEYVGFEKYSKLN